MAKLYKVTAYVVDANGVWTGESLQYEIDNLVDTVSKIIVREADVRAWHDDHPLNYICCPVSAFESYFEEDDNRGR